VSQKVENVKDIAIYLRIPNMGEQLLTLFSKEAIIGNSDFADIRLNDFRCAGVHALLKELDNECFQLIDVGRGNNTFVNGELVKEAVIKSGSEFTIGTSALVVRKIPPIMLEYQDLLPSALTTVEKVAPQKDTSRDKQLITEKNLLQVSLFWGQQMLESRTFKSNSQISIGGSGKATFNVTLLNKEFHKIANYKGGELKLSIPAFAQGIIWQGNKLFSLNDLRQQSLPTEEQESVELIQPETLDLSLRIGDRADIQIGELSLSFQFVWPPEKVPRVAPFELDKKLLKIYASVLGIFLFILLIGLIWPESEEEKQVKIPEKLKKVLFEAGINSAKEKQQSAIGELLKSGGRARGQTGQAKRKVVTKKVKSPEEKKEKATVAKTEVQKPQETKTETTAPSKTQTAQAAPKAMPDLSSVKESSSSNLEDIGVVGKTLEKGNTSSALTSGSFARGSTGLGSGGGGESVGIGQLKGLSTGGGMGIGDVGVNPSKGKEIDVQEREEVVLLDGLDPEVISAIIKRYLPQIQHCYETGLISRPELKGKVLVHFAIQGDGTVARPKILETSLKDSITEKCILDKMKQWRFPKPRGGGVVEVKYPFLLMSTNE